jgi:hypothetical protein
MHLQSPGYLRLIHTGYRFRRGSARLGDPPGSPKHCAYVIYAPGHEPLGTSVGIADAYQMAADHYSRHYARGDAPETPRC